MSINGLTKRLRIFNILLDILTMVLGVLGMIGSLVSFNISSVLLNFYCLYYN